jgi:type I restriction enzyme, S subunit
MLADIAEFQYGFTASASDEGTIRYLRITDITDAGQLKSGGKFITPSQDVINEYRLGRGDIVIARSGSVGRMYQHVSAEPLIFASYLVRARINPERALARYVFFQSYSRQYWEQVEALKEVGAQPNLSAAKMRQLEIPLPSLEEQQRIVSEIEGYRKVIDGARQILNSYQPRLALNAVWPTEKLGNLCEVVRGSSPRPQGDPRYFGGSVPRLMIADITRDGMWVTPQIDSLTEEGAKRSRPMKSGDVVMAVSASPGLPALLKVDACIHDGFAGFRNVTDRVDKKFLYYALLELRAIHDAQAGGATFRNITTDQIREFAIPVPPLDDQHRIVKELDSEAAQIEAVRALIVRFEAKIQRVLDRLWSNNAIEADNLHVAA